MNVLHVEACHLDPSPRSKAFILPVVRKASHSPHGSCPCGRLCSLPRGSPHSVIVDEEISEPSPLASVQDISEGPTQLQSSRETG